MTETGGQKTGDEPAAARAPEASAVFISYASHDSAVAQALVEALERQNIACWIAPRDVKAGALYAEAIVTAISNAPMFILILSVSSIASSHVGKEIERASSKKRPIIALRMDTAALTPALEYFLSESQWIEARAESMQTPYAKLIDALRDPTRPAQAIPAGAAKSGINRHLATAGIVLAIAALALLVDKFWILKPALRYTAISAAASTGAASTAATATALATAVISEKSVAVLPFVDLSEKKDQEYFSDGLSEELIDLLSKVGELRVPARTSSFYFKGQHATIAQIAQALSVAHVLEGSVRKAGNTIRVTAQLIRADNGYHLWSETYDRDLKDVFKVQDDIAQAVVDKLKLSLTSAPATPNRVQNSEAHNFELQGRFFAQEETEPSLEKAIDYFQRAIALEPSAALWGELGMAYFRQVANGYIPVAQGVEKARNAANKGVELDRSNAYPYLVIGILKMSNQHDWVGARAAIDKAMQLDPSNVSALFFDAHVTRTVGNSDAAIAKFRIALDRDPLNLLIRRYMTRALYHAGRLTEAEAMIRQVIEMKPAFPAAHYELGRILLARGLVGPAVTAFEAEVSPGWRAFGLPLGYHAQGRTRDANTAFNKLLQHSAGSEYQVAETYAYFGNSDQAFTWLNRAVDNDPGIQWLRADPLLKGITTDPRYAMLLHRLNLPE